ncbi:MAG: hypothetical protein OEZ38_13610, partial [Gammaproteobacteria bacterium]|nr:hypothetical protein [Gammaproteobacteria bacterium]
MKILIFVVILFFSFLSCFESPEEQPLNELEHLDIRVITYATRVDIFFRTNHETTNEITVNENTYFREGIDFQIQVENLVPEQEYEYNIKTKISESSPIGAEPITYTGTFFTSEEMPIIISKPEIINISPDSISFSFDTDIITNCIIEYGKNESLGNEIELFITNNLNHIVLIEDLDASSTYFIRIRATSLIPGWGETYSNTFMIETPEYKNIEIFPHPIPNSISPSGVTIEIYTNVIASCQVEYSINEDFNDSKIIDSLPANSTNPTAVLSGLSESQIYFYRILSSTSLPDYIDTISNTFTFTTKEKLPVEIPMIKYSSSTNVSTLMCETNTPSYIRFHYG